MAALCFQSSPDTGLLVTVGRAHWGIENSLHYVLDVVFRNGAARITSSETLENWAYFRKIAMMVAQADTEMNDSVKSRVKQMAKQSCYGGPAIISTTNL
jgi:predicted transposase YbfD/YdcC